MIKIDKLPQASFTTKVVIMELNFRLQQFPLVVLVLIFNFLTFMKKRFIFLNY